MCPFAYLELLLPLILQGITVSINSLKKHLPKILETWLSWSLVIPSASTDSCDSPQSSGTGWQGKADLFHENIPALFHVLLPLWASPGQLSKGLQERMAQKWQEMAQSNSETSPMNLLSFSLFLLLFFIPCFPGPNPAALWGEEPLSSRWKIWQIPNKTMDDHSRSHCAAATVTLQKAEGDKGWQRVTKSCCSPGEQEEESKPHNSFGFP